MTPHNTNHTFKVTVIGCGNVGATTAYALLLDGTITHLTLIDINKDRAKGITLDLEHSLPFTSSVVLEATDDFSACADSQLIIITAGKKQEPGQTRLELTASNKDIFRSFIPAITAAAPDAMLLVVTNPVDVLTYETLQLSKFPPHRVFGTGTLLDTARLQLHISQRLKIHPRSIHAHVFGEHGDSSFPVYSTANVMGKQLLDFEEFTPQVAQECYQATKEAAYRIIHDVGYTCYSIATAISELTRNIAKDTHRVFMLSTLLQGYYGHENVCLSVPCVVGKNGIERILDIPLSTTEQEQLAESVRVLKSYQ